MAAAFLHELGGGSGLRPDILMEIRQIQYMSKVEMQ